eukprot:4268290-Alexandrium_andersonii.AAC.1
MSASLVGSEMCIRDRPCSSPSAWPWGQPWAPRRPRDRCTTSCSHAPYAVSYTHLTLPTICSV